MNMPDIIHHYTDINTLALILKNKMIRFNRLDHVDDITEGQSFQVLKLGKFFFVSCWTYDHEESLPQWNMYTKDMAGVRITMPRKLFNYAPFALPKTIPHKALGSFPSPIPFEKIFGDKHFILPMFLDEKNFARAVEYPPDFAERKNQAIYIEKKPDGQPGEMGIKDPVGIAALKSPDWAFQKEYRFVLFIIPSPSLPKDDKFFLKFTEQIPDVAKTALYKGIAPTFDFFDVDIAQHAIDNIKVITGPLCTEGDFIIVESLLRNFAPKGILEKSRFSGTIRKR
jgi:hypothetical protein